MKSTRWMVFGIALFFNKPIAIFLLIDYTSLSAHPSSTFFIESYDGYIRKIA